MRLAELWMFKSPFAAIIQCAILPRREGLRSTVFTDGCSVGDNFLSSWLQYHGGRWFNQKLKECPLMSEK